MATLTYFPQFTGYSSYISQSNLNHDLGTTYLGASTPAVHKVIILTIAFSKYAGIDAPTLIKDETVENKDVIVFVGESPARSSWHYNKSQAEEGTDVIVGAPFGINWAKQVKPGLEIYTDIFVHCLSKNYDVYVTDVNKLYTDLMVDDDLTSVTTAKEVILIDEMKEIRKRYSNVYVVFFGLTPKTFFDESTNKDLGVLMPPSENLVALLHPSAQNWPNWQAHRAVELFGGILKGEDAQQIASYYLKDIKNRNKAVSKWAIDDIRVAGIPRI